MTRHELIRKYGEAYAIIYWHERGSFIKSLAEINDCRMQMIECSARIDAGEYELERNARGNVIYREYEALERLAIEEKPESRYPLDALGWEQFDTWQDAHYFGVWIDREHQRTLTYAEGDISLVECGTPEGFKAELADIVAFYEGAAAG